MAPERKEVDHVELLVTVVSARGLRSTERKGVRGGKSDPYCVCEIPGRLEPASFRTEAKSRTLDPVWQHTGSFIDYLPGEPITFSVYDQDPTAGSSWKISRNQKKNEILLGTATLTSEQMYPDGFSGEIRLQDAGPGQAAFLRVAVALCSGGGRTKCEIEGPLETRAGSSIIGRWEQKWFRIGGGFLDCFAMDDTAREHVQRNFRLSDITKLQVNEAAHECTFYALGKKVRLRAKSEQELRPWLQALNASGSEQDVENEEPEEALPDVKVQVDSVLGVPKLEEDDDSGEACTYFLRARWSGDTAELQTTSCLPEPGSEPDVENCVIKQQLQMSCDSSAEVIILTLFRSFDDDEEQIGECRLNIHEPSNQTVHMHQLTDRQGNTMTTLVRMRLKMAGQETFAAPELNRRASTEVDPTSFKVTIVSARGLRAADRRAVKGSIDPCCVCEVLGQHYAKLSTRVVQNNCNPVWNHTGLVRLCSDVDNLCFTIYDQDLVKRDVPLCRVVLQAQEFFYQGFDGELQLSDPSLRAIAFLRLRIVPAHMKETPERRPTFFGRPMSPSESEEVRKLMAKEQPEPQATALQVRIVRARVLPEDETYLDSHGMDCYCACQLHGKFQTKFQTDVVEDTTEPEWDHSKVIHGYASGDQVDFAIFRQERHRPQELLGRLQLPSSHFDPEGLADELEVLDVKQGFSISLTVEVTPVVSPVAQGKRNARPQSAKGLNRFRELHAMHAQKQDELDRIRRQKEEKEVKSVEEEISRRRQKVGVREWTNRLYEDSLEAEQRRKKLQAFYSHKEREEIENGKPKKLASSHSSPSLHNQETFLQRQAEHAQRHEQWMHQQRIRKEDQQKEVDSKVQKERKAENVGPEKFSEEQFSWLKNREQNVQKKKKEQEDRELANMNSYFADKGGDLRGMERIEELYKDHSWRMKKRKTELVNKREAEASSVRQMASGSPRGGGGNRFEELYAEAEERRKKQESIQKEHTDKILKEAGKTPASSGSSPKAPGPFVPPDTTLASVVAAVQMRSGVRSPVDAAELKALGEPLKNAMALYKDAQAKCAYVKPPKVGDQKPSLLDGFSTLVQRPSMHLFMDNLVPDSQASSSCIEPDQLRQVQLDLQSLMEAAEQAQQALLEPLGLDAEQDESGNIATGEIRANPKVKGLTPLFVVNPGPKTQEAAELKASVRYKPACGPRQFQHLLDLARATLVFESCESLMSGLQALLEADDAYEILEVRNYFATPLRTGRRFVEVIVAVQVPHPHVCELRFEEKNFYKAHLHAQQYLQDFFNELEEMYTKRLCPRPDLVRYLAHSVLSSVPDHAGARQLRRNFAKTFGNTVSGWRSNFAQCGRSVQFQKFNQVCCRLLKSRDYTTEYWMAMDCGRAGIISLFELDPEAVTLLARVRHRILALAADPEAFDAEELFAKLKSQKPASVHAGWQLGWHEFKASAKGVGLNPTEAERAFSYLDSKGGGSMSLLTVADITWLLNLPSLVDLEAACLGHEDFITGQEDDRGDSPRLQRRAWQAQASSPSEGGKRESKEEWRKFTPKDINPVCCMARVWDGGRGGQCTKKRLHGGDFCQAHLLEKSWQELGRVDRCIPPEALARFQQAEAAGGAEAEGAAAGEAEQAPAEKAAAAGAEGEERQKDDPSTAKAK